MESTIETEIKKVTAQIAVSLSDEGIAGDNLVEAIKDKQSQYDSLVALGKQRIPRAIELLGSIGRLQVIKDCCDKVLSLEEERAEAISSAKIQISISDLAAKIAEALSDENLAEWELVPKIQEMQVHYDLLEAAGKQQVGRAVELLGTIARLRDIVDQCNVLLRSKKEMEEKAAANLPKMDVLSMTVDNAVTLVDVIIGTVGAKRYEDEMKLQGVNGKTLLQCNSVKALEQLGFRIAHAGLILEYLSALPKQSPVVALSCVRADISTGESPSPSLSGPVPPSSVPNLVVSTPYDVRISAKPLLFFLNNKFGGILLDATVAAIHPSLEAVVVKNGKSSYVRPVSKTVIADSVSVVGEGGGGGGSGGGPVGEAVMLAAARALLAVVQGTGTEHDIVTDEPALFAGVSQARLAETDVQAFARKLHVTVFLPEFARSAGPPVVGKPDSGEGIVIVETPSTWSATRIMDYCFRDVKVAMNSTFGSAGVSVVPSDAAGCPPGFVRSRVKAYIPWKHGHDMIAAESAQAVEKCLRFADPDGQISFLSVSSTARGGISGKGKGGGGRGGGHHATFATSAAKSTLPMLSVPISITYSQDVNGGWSQHVGAGVEQAQVVFVYRRCDSENVAKVRECIVSKSRSAVCFELGCPLDISLCRKAWPTIDDAIRVAGAAAKPRWPSPSSRPCVASIFIEGRQDTTALAAAALRAHIGAINRTVIRISALPKGQPASLDKSAKLGLLMELKRTGLILASGGGDANSDSDGSVVAASDPGVESEEDDAAPFDILVSGGCGGGPQSAFRPISFAVGFLPPRLTAPSLAPSVAEVGPGQDNADLVSRKDAAVDMLTEIANGYDEVVVPYSLFCATKDPKSKAAKVQLEKELQNGFSLYLVRWDDIKKTVLLCGDSVDTGSGSDLRNAQRHLTVLPEAEVVETTPVLAGDARTASVLNHRVNTEAKKLLMAACRKDTGVTTMPLNPKKTHDPRALFLLRGKKAAVVQALRQAKAALAAFSTGLSESPLGPLTQAQMRYLKRECHASIKRIQDEHGVLISFAAPLQLSGVETSLKGDNVLLRANIQVPDGDPIELRIIHGDLLSTGCQAMVNAANGELCHSGGVARAISDAAGPELDEEGRAVLATLASGRVAVGSAVTTGAYALRGRNKALRVVVHAVGPVHRRGDHAEQALYVRTVGAALTLSVESGAKDIAAPLLGSKIFGWDKDLAASLLIRGIAEWAGGGNRCRRITLVDSDATHAHSLAQALLEFVAGKARGWGGSPSSAAAVQPRPAYLWSWLDDNKKWVPYDYDQAMLIEASAADSTFPVRISGDIQGFKGVSTKIPPGEKYPVYEVDRASSAAGGFDYAQRNMASGFQRQVCAVPFTAGMTMFGYSEGAASAPVVAPAAAPVRCAAIEISSALPSNSPSAQSAASAADAVGRAASLAVFGFAAPCSAARAKIDGILQRGEKTGKDISVAVFATPIAEVLDRLRQALKAAGVWAELSGSDVGGKTTVAVRGFGDTVIALGERVVIEAVSAAATETIANHATIYPSEWKLPEGQTAFDDSKPGFTLETVTDPVEFAFVKDEWLGTSTAPLAPDGPRNQFAGRLLHVQRVQNPMAWTAYLSKVRLLASRNHDPSLAKQSAFVRANEWLMKHGTKGTAPEVIAGSVGGLNFQYSGQGMFGWAAYTAEEASYSHGYRHDLPDGTAQIFLVRVAAGVVHEVAQRTGAHTNLKEPPQGFDSVRGVVAGTQKAIMVYQNDSAYPAYLLTYGFKL